MAASGETKPAIRNSGILHTSLSDVNIWDRLMVMIWIGIFISQIADQELQPRGMTESLNQELHETPIWRQDQTEHDVGAERVTLFPATPFYLNYMTL